MFYKLKSNRMGDRRGKNVVIFQTCGQTQRILILPLPDVNVKLTVDPRIHTYNIYIYVYNKNNTTKTIDNLVTARLQTGYIVCMYVCMSLGGINSETQKTSHQGKTSLSRHCVAAVASG